MLLARCHYQLLMLFQLYYGASLSEPHPLTSLQMLWIIQIWSRVEYLIDFVIIDIVGIIKQQ